MRWLVRSIINALNWFKYSWLFTYFNLSCFVHFWLYLAELLQVVLYLNVIIFNSWFCLVKKYISPSTINASSFSIMLQCNGACERYSGTYQSGARVTVCMSLLPHAVLLLPLIAHMHTVNVCLAGSTQQLTEKSIRMLHIEKIKHYCNQSYRLRILRVADWTWRRPSIQSYRAQQSADCT